ncbi:uncharacterized protein LOC106151384 [Lingula anatina]|uniref:Uncharacterized protein LOC106151384 n=1 Tax=Lingula anatina TaxID=7574 RepID=A0A1S3H223_LINAN|nr:uncharacterized protein LOC106151384 [Lingula anatina]|eukprot:XP_013380068.1 uncharacterized protein LOC106151384 [Lingula anatina]
MEPLKRDLISLRVVFVLGVLLAVTAWASSLPLSEYSEGQGPVDNSDIYVSLPGNYRDNDVPRVRDILPPFVLARLNQRRPSNAGGFAEYLRKRKCQPEFFSGTSRC